LSIHINLFRFKYNYIQKNKSSINNAPQHEYFFQHALEKRPH